VDDDSEEGEGELAQQSLDFDSDEMINPLAEDVKRWGHWVLEEARKEIGHLYEDPMGHKIVGYLWARTSKCVNPSCGAEMPLLKSYWLSKKKVIYLHPIIDKQQKHVQFVIRQGLQEETNPNDATISRSSATCLVCGSHITADEIQEQGNKEGFGEKLVAIIYEVKGETGKRYREVSKQDISIYESVHDEISKREITFPNDELPYLRSIFNVQIYGYDEWGKLFNNRQGLGLSVFANIICTSKFEMLSGRVTKDYADVIVTYLTMAFDRLVDQSATLVTWIYQIEAISHVFTRQALGMIWDYAESNMFNDGGGGFASGIGWVIRTIKKTSQTADTSAILHRGDAARLPYDNAKFDAVVTDPPYYDAVPYADLSDFFYVWMKQILGEIYPDIFATPLSPKSTEIVQIAERNPKYAHKDKAFYEKQMTTSFSEMQRVSVSNGISVVVFAHKSTSAWETLINGLLGSDLVITASWPLNTERTMRLRAQNSGALASSIFIVCRPRNANLEGVYDDVRTRIQARIRERLAFFWKEGIRGADFFISAIGPAVEVFGQYKTVRKLSGDVVTVAELLDIVQYEVADYALSQVMNGGASFGPFDAATRFYIMYRWSYGGNKIEFDDGMRMAMALGAEVDDLMRPNSILKKNGSSVQLLGPSDREKNEHLGEPGRDRMSAPLIDRAHRAALLWRSGQREELRRFVSENVGIEVEALRAVAQALVNVLPDGDKEKQLYEGFLQGELPTMPQSDQMFGDEDF